MNCKSTLYSFSYIFIVITTLLFISGGCSDQDEIGYNSPSTGVSVNTEHKIILGYGIISRVNSEPDFWGIIDEKGDYYKLREIDKRFLITGIKVKYKGLLVLENKEKWRNIIDIIEIKMVDKPIDFETIDIGDRSAIYQEKFTVLKTSASWENFWHDLHKETIPVPTLPYVDFNTEIILAACLGYRMTNGYKIELTDLIETANNIKAYYTVTEPGNKEIPLQKLTQPYHIISVNRTDKPIVFVKK